MRGARPGLSPARLAGRLTATAYPMRAAGPSLAGAGSLDPVAAVTAPAAVAAAPPRAPARAVLPAPTPERGHVTAVVVAGGAVGGAVVTGFVVCTYARARRRGWRPGVAGGRENGHHAGG